MRSGSTVWRAPWSLATPSTTMREVPAPVILAPILLRQVATSPISGSRAALSVSVAPLARRGRHQRGMGAADGDLGKYDLAAAQTVLGARDHVAAFDLDLRAQRLQR